MEVEKMMSVKGWQVFYFAVTTPDMGATMSGIAAAKDMGDFVDFYRLNGFHYAHVVEMDGDHVDVRCEARRIVSQNESEMDESGCAPRCLLVCSVPNGSYVPHHYAEITSLMNPPKEVN
jgi:hypothetical protein